MAEDTAPKIARERSPSFPFIPLSTALNRLKEFEETFGLQPPPAGKVYIAWGYKGDSSQAQQTLAALKAFGLVNYEGSGQKRLVSLSSEARTYLRANQQSIKDDVVRKAALKPAWFERIWKAWGANRHPDEVCLDELVLNHKFNQNTAPRFLSVYDRTIAFAGLKDSDNVEEPDGKGGVDDNGTDGFKVGDNVNWDAAGQIQWRTPWKIVDIQTHDDGKQYLQVQGTGGDADQTGWIPVDEATKENAPGGVPSAFAPKPPLRRKPEDYNSPEIKGLRKAIFPVTGGDVTLHFPEGMTPDDLKELGEYLDIFLKKQKRGNKKGDVKP